MQNFAKFRSPVLTLLWTQEAMSKLVLRALSDLESPRTEVPEAEVPHLQLTSTLTNEDLRYTLKSTERLKFVTLCFCLSYTSPPKDCPELQHLPQVPTGTCLNRAFCELRGVPTTPCTFGSKYSNNCPLFKTQLSYCQSEPELAHYSERGARIN